MNFADADFQLSISDIAQAASEVGFEFPTSVKEFYLRWNGGVPTPYVFENESLDTVVTEFLPLKTNSERPTAIHLYRDLIIRKDLAPKHFFPFAVDGGGDYFFVDCQTAEGTVYFFRGDSLLRATDGLLNLSVGFESFWRALKEE